MFQNMFWDSQVNIYVKSLINIYFDALATKCRIATVAKQAWNRFIPCWLFTIPPHFVLFDQMNMSELRC